MATPHERIDRPTRTGRAYTTVAGAIVVLLLIIVFVAQNGTRVKVNFLFLHGHMALGLALLLAAVLGAALVALSGGARILQLRHRARAHRKSADSDAADLGSAGGWTTTPER